jgi:putative ABC transport system ATP-binding protein
MRAAPLLLVDAVTKTFAGARPRTVLNGVSLRLDHGEYVAIMGESGSGKSTLLNLIAGLDVPDDGRIILDTHDLASLDEDGRTRLRRARIGFVFQAFHLLPHLSVARNVALPLALNGAEEGAMQARVREVLDAVGMLDRSEDLPAQLSGGEMQRVAVARALAHRPALVLADEPTGNLDADSADEVLALMKDQLRRDGASAILVTHSQRAAATADRMYRLSSGRLEELG